MKVLCTGGEGFIGTALCLKLRELGHETAVLDTMQTVTASPRRLIARGKRLDMADCKLWYSASSLEHVMVGSDAIVHLAALPGVRYSLAHPREVMQTNVALTATVLDTAALLGVSRVIFASSSSIYGDGYADEYEEMSCPLSPYGVSKLSGELLCYAFEHCYPGLHVTILRLFSVYGPDGRRDMMPFKLMQAADIQEPVDFFGNGTIKRAWTYIDDVVDAFIVALELPLEAASLTCNIATNPQISLNALATIVENVSGKTIPRRYVETPPTEPDFPYVSIDVATNELCWEPKVGIEVGIRRMWDWYVAEGADLERG